MPVPDLWPTANPWSVPRRLHLCPQCGVLGRCVHDADAHAHAHAHTHVDGKQHADTNRDAHPRPERLLPVHCVLVRPGGERRLPAGVRGLQRHLFWRRRAMRYVHRHPHGYPNADADGHTHRDCNAQPHSDADANVHVHADANAHADAYAHPDVHPHAHPHANTGSERLLSV